MFLEKFPTFLGKKKKNCISKEFNVYWVEKNTEKTIFKYIQIIVLKS